VEFQVLHGLGDPGCNFVRQPKTTFPEEHYQFTTLTGDSHKSFAGSLNTLSTRLVRRCGSRRSKARCEYPEAASPRGFPIVPTTGGANDVSQDFGSSDHGPESPSQWLSAEMAEQLQLRAYRSV